ncbi:hypothetical protein GUITHDRAFT_115815 [Guillardia theta CCMP2712]|uniref:Tubby C-terminal domain-containing protein n=1 Tax=Guillardia theta (strain CCMP2712) TaxID=905079 RepID=L1IP59_GUITC|nr:hypothetical protein GUITHDRAFT_115815 [Guillardia theta CCMP2712]EKX38053.1 hypothetical protein GUITHDRAFT_115815 [Guillardia theta CCMP2712]|mmetsp:Transcript_31191/g.100075  ORF Transcript_31191/g.100075 Transcript_31191/m.100075 type:complete len:269 (-) Transcript_31191:1363-2169(-)|eukprot:XP_005825033.1 hypothetical protein GUITHDRAFT_115815 [Guillardia theta CCMP2712]
MGQTESCCCKRSQNAGGNDASQSPSISLDVLGNQYVTFRSDQQESFLIRSMIFYSKSSHRIRDMANNTWFRMEGPNAKETGVKHLILNTDSVHATLMRIDEITWKIVVSRELRALVYKCVRTNQYCIRVFSPPYPPEDYGQLILEEVVPDVVLEGDYDNMSMSFLLYDSEDVFATMERTADFQDSSKGTGWRLLVQIAANVDVALVLLTCICVDAMEREPELEQDSFDKVKAPNGKRNDSIDTMDKGRKSSVPTLWDKGHTPRVVKEI